MGGEEIKKGLSPFVTPADHGNGLRGAANWAATGFMFLAGALAFLGITQGPLDRILGAFPRQGLLIFVLVGAGVVLAVVAPVLPSDPAVRAGYLVVIGAILLGLVYVFMPNLDDPEWTRSLAVLGVVVCIIIAVAVATVLWQIPLPLNAAALAVALMALSLGLYSAVKLAVISKSPSDLGALTTEVTSGARGDLLVVTVSLAGNDPAGSVLVQVADTEYSETDDSDNAHRNTEDVETGDSDTDNTDPGGWTEQQHLVSDATGVVHETVGFLLPVPSPTHAYIRLFRCGSDQEDCTDARALRSARLVARDSPAAVIALAPDDADRLTATVGGEGFRTGATARLCVTVADEDGTEDGVFSAQLAAGAGGSLAGEYRLPAIGPNRLVTATVVEGAALHCPATSAVWGEATYRTLENSPEADEQPDTGE